MCLKSHSSISTLECRFALTESEDSCCFNSPFFFIVVFLNRELQMDGGALSPTFDRHLCPQLNQTYTTMSVLIKKNMLL